MDIGDKVLVEQCREGNLEAFGMLVERYQGIIFNYLVKMTSSWHAADELTHETFLRAYHKLGLYNSRYSFRNWLLTIASNMAKNRFRSTNRRRVAEAAAANSIETFENDNFTTGTQLAEVDEILAEMPPRMRAPLVLRHMEGLSYEEISHILHIGVSAAKMRTMRAREEFVHRLGANGNHRND